MSSRNVADSESSVGHVILDSLAARFRVQFKPDRALRGFVARTRMQVQDGEVDLTLYKPSTCLSTLTSGNCVHPLSPEALMNITGPSVSAALKGTGIPASSMVVTHDFLDRAPCTVARKWSGSASGHNGVRSVIAALGSNKDFHRLRVGIGRDEGANVVDYVLGSLSPKERAFWSTNGLGTELVFKELSKIISKDLNSP